MFHFKLALRGAALSLLTAATLVLTGCGAKNSQSLAEDGKAAYVKKDYKTAIVQFKGALQGAPGTAELRLMLGDSLLETGDAPGAVVELTKALEQGMDADQAVPRLARALVRAGDSKRLVLNYGNVNLKDKDAQASLKASLSNAWERLGDKAKAQAEFDNAVAISPDYPVVALMRARSTAEKKQFDAALKIVEGVLAKDDQLPDAWVLKGELLSMDKRNASAAEAAFRKALELDKTNLAAHFSLVNLHLRLNDLAAAKKDAEAQRAALPGHPYTAFVDAQLALVAGDLPRARDISQKLMNRLSNDVGVLQLAGAVALLSRELVQAESHYSKVLQIAPQSVQARRELARVYLQLGQPRRAMETLRPVLESSTDDAEAVAVAGDAQLALGDPAAAEALFLRAAKLTPDDARVRTSLALTHLARGDADTAFGELAAVASSTPGIAAEQAAFAARLRRREFEAALALVDQIAKKNPKSLLQFELRGRVHLANRDFVKARKAFEEELAADPKVFAATSNLAVLDLLENKPDAARKRLQASIEADPKNVYALMALADLQTNTGAPLEEVKGLLTKAIQVAPQLAEPRLRLIALTLRKRLYKEALVAAQEAAAALPNDPAVLDAVGRAQMEAGDVEQSISTFRKMAGGASNSGVAYTRLADIYKATGKRDQAEAVLRKAIEVDPELVAAQTSLVELLFTTNRKAEAFDFIKRQQRESPGRPLGYGMEAIFHLRNKEPLAAVAAYRAGLAKSGSAPLAVALHRLLTRLGQTKEAEQLAATWIKAHPEDRLFAYQVAEAAIGRNQLGDAELRLANLQRLEPDNVLVLNNLAYVLIKQGKAGALPLAQKAADLAPDNSSVLDTLALALATDKQFDKALSAQKRAVELDPGADNLRLSLVTMALKAGDKTLARTELTRLQGLGAKFKQQDEVTRLLKTL